MSDDPYAGAAGGQPAPAAPQRPVRVRVSPITRPGAVDAALMMVVVEVVIIGALTAYLLYTAGAMISSFDPADPLEAILGSFVLILAVAPAVLTYLLVRFGREVATYASRVASGRLVVSQIVLGVTSAVVFQVFALPVVGLAVGVGCCLSGQSARGWLRG